MNESRTEVQQNKSSSGKDDAHHAVGKLGDYKIPKKTRESKYVYRESDEDESDTNPYEENSSDEQLSGSDAEEGEIAPSFDEMSTSHRSGRGMHAEAASDKGSDSERFDPLDKSSELVITGSMARYVTKYFNTYVNEACVKEKVLEDVPVPENDCFTPPIVDDFIEDLIGSRKAWRFMKMHDNSLKFIQKKVAQIMGPLFKVWLEIDGANQGKERSEMSITAVLNLVERTVLLVGQVNVACLYERRVNFMAKILKGMKFAKQTLTHNQELLTDSGEVLFGHGFYNVLDKKSKNRKRAREMAREMGLDTKRRRTGNPPFQSTSSSSQQGQTGGTGRGGTQSSSAFDTRSFPKPGYKSGPKKFGRKKKSTPPRK